MPPVLPVPSLPLLSLVKEEEEVKVENEEDEEEEEVKLEDVMLHANPVFEQADTKASNLLPPVPSFPPLPPAPPLSLEKEEKEEVEVEAGASFNSQLNSSRV